MSKKARWYFNYKLIGIVLVLIITIGFIIGLMVYRHKLYYHFAVVRPGILYRSGTLSERGLNAVHNLTHFKTIVNVRSVAENNANKNGWYIRETKFCKEHGLNHFNIPMITSIPPTQAQLKEFFDIVTDPKMQPVLIY